MSQITRCPSCSTTFKVVADQLRISEGWVRCGQCKEVFDASAHLLAAAPAALLPDVSLTDVRPPPTPVTRPVDAGRAWGRPAVSSSPAAGPAAQPSAMAPDTSAPPLQRPADPKPTPADPVVPEELPQNVDDLQMASAEILADGPTLEVPLPAVPAFLSTAPGAEDLTAPLNLDSAPPFSWRARAPGADIAAGGPDGGASAGDVTAPIAPIFPAAAASPVALAADKPLELPSQPLPPLPSLPGGYELPAAEPTEGGDVLAGPDASMGFTPMGFPALELPVRTAPPLGEPESSAAPQGGGVAPSPVPQEGPVSLPSVDFAPLAASLTSEPEPFTLVEDRSPAAVLQATARKPSAVPAGNNEADDDEDHAADAGPDVSFVRAARRQAFWRKPQVRVALVAMILLAMAGLTLQVAVHERDRLAAADPRLRPMLLALCASLQCEIAPQRQIADIVIDSSSFNKARGDSYHLGLTMKSKASIPLAMPAVELTLTDAQDQPMLRRVLLPTDMGAPVELPAGGEWSASLSVIVTTGGARVTGYRLLAFYP